MLLCVCEFQPVLDISIIMISHTHTYICTHTHTHTQHNSHIHNTIHTRTHTRTHQKSPTFPERTPRPHTAAATSSSPQLDAATMDGVLLKRGKIVKNWKSRLFVLDPEKREV